jgi:hypothetical protein
VIAERHAPAVSEPAAAAAGARKARGLLLLLSSDGQIRQQRKGTKRDCERVIAANFVDQDDGKLTEGESCAEIDTISTTFAKWSVSADDASTKT